LPEFLLLTERVSRHLRTSASASIALAKQRERRFVGPGLSFVVKPQAGRAAFTAVEAPLASFNSNIAFNVQTERKGFAVPRPCCAPNSEGVFVEVTDV
jgi:hypothetical protein